MRRTIGITVLIVIVLLIGAAAIAACGGKPAEPTQAGAALDGATLLQERCTVCHTTDRITQAHKSSADWESTVTRMVDKGAQLTDAEKAVLVEYLAAHYGG